jgi:tetratricopeptide (TPR) repeat protein
MSDAIAAMVTACNKAGHLNNAATGYIQTGDYATAEARLNEGLALIQPLPGAPLVKRTAMALVGNLGLVEMHADRLPEAFALFELQEKLAEEIGDQQTRSNALNNRALCLLSLGLDDEAEKLLEQRIILARELGDKKGEGNSLNNLAGIFTERKQYGPAQALLHQRITIARSIQDRRGEASSLLGLGEIHKRLKRTADAKRAFADALPLLEAEGDPRAEQVKRWIAEM